MNTTNHTDRYDPLARILNASRSKGSDLMTQQSRTVSYGVSGVVTLLSLLGMATSTQWIKNLSALGFTSGLTLASATCLSSKRIDETFQDYQHKEALERDRLAKLVNDADLERDRLWKQMEAEREGARQTITELGAKLFTFSNAYKDVSSQNGSLRGELEALGKALDRKKFDEDKLYRSLIYGFTEAVKVELDILINEQLVQLKSFITEKLPKFTGTATEKALTQLVELIDTKMEAYQDIINALTPDYDNPQNDLKEFVGIFNQIHGEVSSLKIRFKNALTVNERLRLKQSVDRQYAVDQLEKLARSQDDFQLSYEQALEEIERLVDVVEQHRSTIVQLEDRLNASKVKPVEFVPASRDDLRMANLIIQYFYKQGVWLDRCFSKYLGHSAKVSFHVDRNDPPIEVKVLNEHAEQLQDLTRCLNKPEFKRVSETGIVEVEIQISQKPKVEANTDDVSKLWEPASRFKAIASTWSRVRITGGSEAGKSPTAENLAVCILDVRAGRARLYNPMFDSQKNYWTIPTVGKSHSDSASGIKALAQQVKDRANGEETREEHILTIFDEIDSTMSESSKPREISEQVKYIIKQASHQNLSAIFIGQSANVSNYPGMQRTDWNSAVNVHIGLNAFDAIQNSNIFKGSQLEALLKQAQRLNDYCSSKNEELGLQPNNPKAYRFALVVDPSKPAYFIELPEFGAYTYSDKSLEASSAIIGTFKPIALSPNLEALVESSSVGTVTLTVTCPSCSSENVRKHGTVKGKTRYKCLNDLCSRKTFTV